MKRRIQKKPLCPRLERQTYEYSMFWLLGAETSVLGREVLICNWQIARGSRWSFWGSKTPRTTTILWDLPLRAWFLWYQRKILSCFQQGKRKKNHSETEQSFLISCFLISLFYLFFSFSYHALKIFVSIGLSPCLCLHSPEEGKLREDRNPADLVYHRVPDVQLRGGHAERA